MIRWLILGAIAYWIYRRITAPTPARRDDSHAATADDMTRDPVCGTWVSSADALREIVDGRPVYFCSSRCRDTFISGGDTSRTDK